MGVALFPVSQYVNPKESPSFTLTYIPSNVNKSGFSENLVMDRRFERNQNSVKNIDFKKKLIEKERARTSLS